MLRTRPVGSSFWSRYSENCSTLAKFVSNLYIQDPNAPFHYFSWCVPKHIALFPGTLWTQAAFYPLPLSDSGHLTAQGSNKTTSGRLLLIEGSGLKVSWREWKDFICCDRRGQIWTASWTWSGCKWFMCLGLRKKGVFFLKLVVSSYTRLLHHLLRITV